jgi:hypothetical protein
MRLANAAVQIANLRHGGTLQIDFPHPALLVGLIAKISLISNRGRYIDSLCFREKT